MMVRCAEWVHFVLSTLVLVVFCLAALQSVLLTIQDWMLKYRQNSLAIRCFPSLETMETGLFCLLVIMVSLLTLLLITGWLFFQLTLPAELWPKILLSLLAWLVLVILLVGRRCLGWRGKIAVRLTLLSVALVVAVYATAVWFVPVLKTA